MSEAVEKYEIDLPPVPKRVSKGRVKVSPLIALALKAKDRARWDGNGNLMLPA